VACGFAHRQGAAAGCFLADSPFFCLIFSAVFAWSILWPVNGTGKPPALLSQFSVHEPRVCLGDARKQEKRRRQAPTLVRPEGCVVGGVRVPSRHTLSGL